MVKSQQVEIKTRPRAQIGSQEQHIPSCTLNQTDSGSEKELFFVADALWFHVGLRKGGILDSQFFGGVWNAQLRNCQYLAVAGASNCFLCKPLILLTDSCRGQRPEIRKNFTLRLESPKSLNP